MKWVVLLFVGCTVYGLFTLHFGGALLAAGMALFTVYASRHFDNVDQEWQRDRANAGKPEDTTSLLCKHECEGS